MSTLSPFLQTVSVSTALLAAGGIAILTLFDVPILRSQPASRSLPSTRWLFSRGSHIFPTEGFISSAGFVMLASQTLPVPISKISKVVTSRGLRALRAKSGGYILAGLLCLFIGPWTSFVMAPNNLAIIKLNADKNGSRSDESARVLKSSSKNDGKRRKSLDSVNGKGEANQWTDLSGPQEETPMKSSSAEDEKVREMLGVFGRQNMVRAVFMGLGGVVGLLASLA